MRGWSTSGSARRLLVIAIAAGLAACAARRPTRASVEQCVGRADAQRRQCVQECEGDFEDAFVACYGGPDACTHRCQTQQLACQDGPLRELDVCAGSFEAAGSCAATLRADREACRGRPDTVACDREARRRAAACWQACQRTQAPALARCAEAFRACLDGCIVPARPGSP